MAVSYNGLWKIMKERSVLKTDLVFDLSISSATIAKLGKRKYVSLDVLERICGYLDCNIGDIVSFEKDGVRQR